MVDIHIDLGKLHTGQQHLAREVLYGEKGLVFGVCGRRWGKTFGLSRISIAAFLELGWNVFYAAPSLDQASTYWDEVDGKLRPMEEARLLRIDRRRRLITPSPYLNINPKARIRVVHSREPHMLRGGWGDLIILDEYQLQRPVIFEEVVQPMRADSSGKVVFLFTPPNVRQDLRRNPDALHARDLVLRMKGEFPGGPDKPDPDATFLHYSTFDNPHVDKSMQPTLKRQMSDLRYRQEIDAQLILDNPDALWQREHIEHRPLPADGLKRIVIGVDPRGGGESECGIVAAGIADDENESVWVLADGSMMGTPDQWARRAVGMFYDLQADRIVVEDNFGGDMAESIIRNVDKTVPITRVRARRDKWLRADPVLGLYEQDRVFHLPGGHLQRLEDQMCMFVVGRREGTDRVDGMVHAVTDLALSGEGPAFFLYSPKAGYTGDDDITELDRPPQRLPDGEITVDQIQRWVIENLEYQREHPDDEEDW